MGYTVLMKRMNKGPRGIIHFHRVSNQKLKHGLLRSKLFIHQKFGHPE